jgi:ornithine cyclodeaminase/alanine dehydrogenase
MADDLLYLSRRDVAALAITPHAAREAVLAAFRDHAAGRNRSLPKNTLEIGPGHGFQAMCAASEPDGVATVKWVAMAPVPPGSAVPGINALICANDLTSGAPLALMDGDGITLIRTAAMSAAAASLLAPPEPKTIGFVGCGLQAHAHLAAFRDLYPGLTGALMLSRSRGSAERLAEAARASGLGAEIVDAADALLARCDIVISMVPGAPGLKAFLDAGRLPAHAFVAAVDIGRSWIPATLPAFNLLVTDSLAQSQAPYDVDGRPVATAAFQDDLIRLSAAGSAPIAPRRTLFCFRGLAIADLALANLALQHARAAGIGTRLER